MQNREMEALVYTAPHTVELQQMPEPELQADEVLVRVSVAGICGSDVLGFLGKSRIRKPPTVMGHEFTGRVEAMGEAVSGLSVGQRVVIQPLVGCGVCRWCRDGRSNICPWRELIGAHRPGAFAPYVKAPARVVYPIPNSLTDVAGALVEPLGNAVHMLGLGGHQVYRDVVVLGAGTLGLLAAATARLAGARSVTVTDTQPHRLEVAERLGADVTLNALEMEEAEINDQILAVTEDGPDLVLDAVGLTATRRQAIAVAKPGGTVVFLGSAEPESQLPIADVVNREIALRGSYSCTDEEFWRAIEILADGAIETESWVEMTTLDHGQEYFERLVSAPGDLVKVMFRV